MFPRGACCASTPPNCCARSETLMRRTMIPLLSSAVVVLLRPGAAAAQAKSYALESAEGLKLHNVVAAPAMLEGKKGVRTQYISHPAWTWARLRKETPGRYESYVDLAPGTWTKVRIEVRGDKARLYVHDRDQPALIVNDLKSGASARGAVALWLGAGTVAHFRNLTIKPDPDQR
jgi:hypothetical protein